MSEKKKCPLQFHHYNHMTPSGHSAYSIEDCIEERCQLWRTDRGLGWCGLSGKPVSGKVVAAVEPFDLYKLSLIGGTLKLTDGIEIRAPEPTPEVLARLIAGLRRAVRDS